MKPICILRHLDCEGAGYLETVLERNAVPFRLIAIDQGMAPRLTPDDFSALVLMGGPMSVNDPLPWIAKEIDLIRDAHARALPILGHCLGAQLIAKAFGEVVKPNHSKEIGWFDIDVLSSDAVAQRWVSGLPERFSGFHWHGETYGLPKNALPLFRSRLCEQQGFALGNTLALQFHVEITPDMIKEWARRNAGELACGAPGVQTEGEMLDRVQERVHQLHLIADALYDAWLAPLARG